jgi:1,4-dihydroxy-2-naphthoyl-CoA hydrolase
MTPAELHALMHESMPFGETLGIEPLAAAKDEVRARIVWAPERCTGGGLMHGGVLMSLADSTGGICAFLNLPNGASTTTIESKTNFLRGVRDGHVESVSRPIHVGRTVIVVETELHDANGRLVGKTTQTQAVLAPR